MLFYVYRFLFSLCLTIAIETLVLWLMMRKQKNPTRRIVTAGLFASGMTIPYVWFVFPYLMYGNLFLAVALAEFFAYSVETVFYRWFFGISWKRAIAISVVANTASFAIGQALHFLAR